MSSYTSTNDLVLLIIAVLLLLGIGIAFFIWGRRSVEHIRRAHDWLRTTGTVDRSSVERKSSRRGRNFLGARNTTYYQPVIEYTYNAIGRPYQGSRYRIPDGWMTPYQKVAENIIDRYPAGTQIEVLYDPENPAEAALEISKAGVWRGMQIMGAVLLIVAGILLLYGGNLARQGLGMEVAKNAIPKSPAALSVSKSQIQTGIEQQLGWNCQKSEPGFSGINVAYEGWTCKPTGNEGVLFVDIWNRKDDPEKVDLLWVVTDSIALEGKREKLTTLVKLAVPQGGAPATESWVEETLSQANRQGYQAGTTIDGVPLEIRVDNRFFLLIGESK